MSHLTGTSMPAVLDRFLFLSLFYFHLSDYRLRHERIKFTSLDSKSNLLTHFLYALASYQITGLISSNLMVKNITLNEQWWRCHACTPLVLRRSAGAKWRWGLLRGRLAPPPAPVLLRGCSYEVTGAPRGCYKQPTQVPGI